MDGTLLDTEVLARACFERACRDLGWSADAAIYDLCVGATWEATEQIMRSGFGNDFPYEKISARWSKHYHDFVDHQPVPIKPGIDKVLKKLQEMSVPMAVATSSHRNAVETKLSLAGIDHHFQHLVCAGETLRGKPQPDPYLAAVAGLGLPGSRVWAVEDSDNGVRSAHAAGLVVFQIPDELAPLQEIVKLGHEILDSALELLPRLG
jgi:HAD superfamily hydrolase (TIGR01509 family)